MKDYFSSDFLNDPSSEDSGEDRANMMAGDFLGQLTSDLPDFMVDDEDFSMAVNPAVIHSPSGHPQFGSRGSTSSSVDSDNGSCDLPELTINPAADLNFVDAPVVLEQSSPFNGLGNPVIQSFPPSPSNSEDSQISSTAFPLIQPNVVNVTDLSNVKIPIPKIAKPPAVLKREPIILTSDQFAQLTSSGVLKMQSPPTPEIITPLPIKQESGCPDVKTLKRQQRMIKNRESACLSRKKKKEYLTNVELQLSALSNENRELKLENERLKARVEELESEKTLGWTIPWPLSDGKDKTIKKTTALLALVFFVTLNANHLSGLYGQHHDLTKTAGGPQVTKVGRSLLWQRVNSTIDNQEDLHNTTTNCHLPFNLTESMRVENQLRGWFSNRTIATGRNSRKVRRRKPLTGLDVPKRGHEGPFYHMFMPPNLPRRTEDLSFYNVPRHTYESFFEAIDRQDDRFYVVSFSGDHLLLPASAKNESTRPRMSLIMPSVRVNLNDTMQPPAQHVAMMQIECEVINTKLLHIKEDAIPASMASKTATPRGQKKAENKIKPPGRFANLSSSTDGSFPRGNLKNINFTP